jgi:rhodanese-related sulfurtransferase
MINEINVNDLKERLDNGEKLFILDVREQHEFDAARIPGSTLIPLGTLPDHLDQLEAYKDVEFVVHCRSGARSANACQFLMANGFKNPKNLQGGIMAWARFIDPSMMVM